MAFQVGQKVVLVGWRQAGVNTWHAAHPDARYPNVGDVYTVRAIKPWEDTAVLLLQEIDNTHLGYKPEPGFRQHFFRPVMERKAGASISKKARIPSGRKIREDA